MEDKYFGFSSLSLVKKLIQQELNDVEIKRLTVQVTIIDSFEMLVPVEEKDRSKGRGSKLLLYGNSTRDKERIRKELNDVAE